MPLSSDDHIHLAAAEGFIILGMFLDADAALQLSWIGGLSETKSSCILL